MSKIEDRDILYGFDHEENIVAIEAMSNQPIVEIFTRENDKLKSRYEPYEYFLHVTEDEPMLEREDVKSSSLLGTQHYNKLIKTKDTNQFYNLKKSVRDSFEIFNFDSQYMLQAGKTLFKGMKFNDPLVLYFDLEVMTKEGYDFPNANREEDEIFIVAVRTNRGDEHVFYVGEEEYEHGDVKFHRFHTEKKMIEAFILIVRSINPDVIANHNIFNFDLDYLQARCNLYGIDLALGRDGSNISHFATKIKFADRTRDYNNYNIYGRHIIDTQFLCEYADVVLRNMPSYQLKEVVKYLGQATDDRTYIPGEDISDVWRGINPLYDKEDLLKYAIEDVREAEIVYNEFGQSIFTLTQMVPMSYQDVFRYGTGNQVEYVFTREYMRQGWSYPKKDEHRKIKGGYADVLKFGMVKGSIIYADVKSLYPSLGKILKIQPKKDELKIYQKILNLLVETRYAIKARIKEYEREGNDEMVQQQKATDGSVKIFLNTMAYGFIASPFSSFNDYDEAERITTTGQKIMKQMNEIIKDDGGLPIKIDTDGVAMLMPDGWDEEEYVQHLTDLLPEGIIIECDGKYDGIISFDRKSYALLEKDGEVKVKGNTLIGRSIENFCTDFTKDCIKVLLTKDNHTECEDIYDYYRQNTIDRKWEGQTICKRANINMSLEEYTNKNESGNTQTIATYELAKKAKKPYTKGDVIKYYIKEYPWKVVPHRGKPKLKKLKLKNYEAAELLDNYNYDYEIDYYTDRLETIAKKFMCLGKDKFEEIFNKEIYPKAADIRRYEELTGRHWSIIDNNT